jgi:hypothetical protein
MRRRLTQRAGAALAVPRRGAATLALAVVFVQVGPMDEVAALAERPSAQMALADGPADGLRPDVDELRRFDRLEPFIVELQAICAQPTYQLGVAWPVGQRVTRHAASLVLLEGPVLGIRPGHFRRVRPFFGQMTTRERD